MEEKYLIPTTLQVKECAGNKVCLRVLQIAKGRNISVIFLLILLFYSEVERQTHTRTRLCTYFVEVIMLYNLWREDKSVLR